MHHAAIVLIQDEASEDIIYKLEILLSPGDVGNSSPLLFLLVKPGIWHWL